MTEEKFAKGLDQARVQRPMDHYEQMSDAELRAHDVVDAAGDRAEVKNCLADCLGVDYSLSQGTVVSF